MNNKIIKYYLLNIYKFNFKWIDKYSIKKCILEIVMKFYLYTFNILKYNYLYMIDLDGSISFYRKAYQYGFYSADNTINIYDTGEIKIISNWKSIYTWNSYDELVKYIKNNNIDI